MWFWRRVEKVQLKERKTNEEVLDLVGPEWKLLEEIRRRRSRWREPVVVGGKSRGMLRGRMLVERRRKGKGIIHERKTAYGDVRRLIRLECVWFNS
jgi:hypothetical protein